MILFLDFDGVLHSTTATPEKLFCKLPLLEEMLREFPGISIVISSSWRYYNSLSELKEFFTPDIGARIIGVTPHSPDTHRQTINTLKENEILAYLQQSNYANRQWLALDDLQRLFPNYQQNLISCSGYKGIDEIVIKELRARLVACLDNK